MKRPTISICVIAKNEEQNLPRLTKSIEGCFDNYYLTDTGSTDGTVELAKKLGWQVSHFEWVKDFAAARNFNFSQSKDDYIMWLDLDDTLTGKENFIHYRDHSLGLATYHLVTYDYAHYPDGRPAVSFVRERIIKNNQTAPWKHFLHEGIPGRPGDVAVQIPGTVFKIRHERTPEDLAKDKGRNIGIFDFHMKNGVKLDTRMKFYYGKELFEIGRPDEAIPILLDAASSSDCEPHDRLLAIQYAAFSCMHASNMLNWEVPEAKLKGEKLLVDAINIAKQGTNIDPNRAEFWTIMGDSCIKLGKLADAIPYFGAAMRCQGAGSPTATFSSPIFSFAETSTTYPRNQLTRCYFNLGDLHKAKLLAQETADLYNHEDSKKLLEEIKRIEEATTAYKKAEPCDDIVISCPPTGMYDWDEELYKTRGMGGSETAAIELARQFKIKTGRRVIVFNGRKEALKAESGVEYFPSEQINSYMGKNRPAVHIAWRHNMKCTDAKTYLWCHDLFTQGVESQHNFDKHICLSNFHANYVSSMQGVPKDKIWVSRNGIVSNRFKDKHLVTKDPMKLIYPSSPDRGLDLLIPMLDLVRERHPIELHVFYGFENLYKTRRPETIAFADRVKKMIEERPWIKFHGNTEQKELTRHFMEASLWVYPTNFTETFCITAVEALCAGVYPVARAYGALPDTLKEAYENGDCTLLEEPCVTEEQRKIWAKEVCDALTEKRWEKLNYSAEKYDWEKVADEFVKEMNIEQRLV